MKILKIKNYSYICAIKIKQAFLKIHFLIIIVKTYKLSMALYSFVEYVFRLKQSILNHLCIKAMFICAMS